MALCATKFFQQLLLWDQPQRSGGPILKGTVKHKRKLLFPPCIVYTFYLLVLYTFYLHVLYTPTLTLQFTSVQRDFSTETIGLVSKDTKWVSLVRWGQQDWMEYQEDKRSAISWRSNLFWDASITPLHSAFTRTSLMIAAACPVGSSDVLRSMNICTTLGQSIKLFY